jgi:hypothetical protein
VVFSPKGYKCHGVDPGRPDMSRDYVSLRSLGTSPRSLLAGHLLGTPLLTGGTFSHNFTIKVSGLGFVLGRIGFS